MPEKPQLKYRQKSPISHRPRALRWMVNLFALCLLVQGCATYQIEYPSESGPPRNWAFFIDLSFEKDTFFGYQSTPGFLNHIKNILVEKYNYNDDDILFFTSVEKFRLKLYDLDFGIKVKNGGSVVVYFYRSEVPGYLQLDFEKRSLYDTSDAFYSAFMVISDLERISKSNVFAIFDGCNEGLASAFEARIQEFKGLFNQHGRIELFADCDFKRGQAQFRKRISSGFENKAAERSGRLTGEQLAMWAYGQDDKKIDQMSEIGKSYFSSQRQISQSQKRETFEWIPSFSQMKARIISSNKEIQRETAFLIRRQLSQLTRFQSKPISAAELKDLWEVVGMDGKDLKARLILMETLTHADKSLSIERLRDFITDKYSIDMRKAATENLALIRESEALELQRQQLQSENLTIREAAFGALMTWRDTSEVAYGLYEQAFTLLGEDTEENSKLRMIRTLVVSAVRQNTPGEPFNRDKLGQELLAVIDMGSPAVRREVVFALREIKYKPGKTKLIHILLDKNDAVIVRSAAAYSIGEVTKFLGHSELRQIDTLLMEEERPSIRAGAAYLLGKLDNIDEESVDTLITATWEDSDEKVRVAAIDALSTKKNEAVTKALIRATKDQDQLVRLKALNELGKQVPNRMIIERLDEIAKSVDSKKPEKALASKLLESVNFTESIKTINNEKASIEDKINAVESLDALVRAGAVEDDDELIKIRDAVFKLFAESVWDLRTKAIRTLEVFPNRLIREEAGKMLEDTYPVTRATAVRFIAHMGYPEYQVKALDMLSHDEEISVRIESAIALANPAIAYGGAENGDVVIVIEKLLNVATTASEKLLRNAAVSSAVLLLAYLERNVNQPQEVDDLLGLVVNNIAATQHIVSPHNFYRTLSYLVGGRFYGKSAKNSDDAKQAKMLSAARDYYLLAVESVPSIQTEDTAFRLSIFSETVLFHINYLERGEPHFPLNREVKNALQKAELFERNDVIRSAILMELTKLYNDTNRPEEAIRIYNVLVGRLSLLNLKQSIVFTKVLTQFSHTLFRVEKFADSAKFADTAMANMTLPDQIQNELLVDEQAQMLDLIDTLSARSDYGFQSKQSRENYQTVEANLRQLCIANKANQEYCVRFQQNGANR